MSFFKKLTKEFDELTDKFDNLKPKAKEEGSSGKRDFYPPQQGYTESHHSSAPCAASHPPPRERQAAPVYSPPSDKPPIPAGWVPQWDEQYQRWFYHDTTTGRSQWEAPGYVARGDEAHYHDASGDYHAYPSGVNTSDKSKSGHGDMLIGAAGGMVAGALLSNALQDDDDYRSYPPPAPVHAPAYADSVSSSDRESLEEAREEYREALDDARSSSASSSDYERLEEAREEYYSEAESAYGSD